MGGFYTTGSALVERCPRPAGTEFRATGYCGSCYRNQGERMARKYSKAASKDVEKALQKLKQGKLKSGPGGKGGKVTSRKQAIAIGLSEARAEGKKVPKTEKKKTR
jgi:hypothetical protein